MAQLSGQQEGYPTLPKEDVVPLFSKERDWSKFTYEPQNGIDLEKQLREHGDGFFRKSSEGTADFLKNLPSDVEIYHVPMDSFEGGSNYKPEDQLMYMKVSPKVG
jgi:hypothetical protein